MGSMVLMVVMAWKIDIERGGYASIVGITIAFILLSAIWVVRELKALTNRGPKTVRYLLVLFGKILKHAPPFDPYSTSRLGAI